MSIWRLANAKFAAAAMAARYSRARDVFNLVHASCLSGSSIASTSDALDHSGKEFITHLIPEASGTGVNHHRDLPRKQTPTLGGFFIKNLLNKTDLHEMIA